MTDYELLRLAAIACGELSGEWRNNEAYFDGVLSRWNPLTDDGDALRLAVRLGLRIYTPDEDDKTAVVRDYAGLHVTQEASATDFCAATRLAIVRAAAAIGRAALAQEGS